MIYSLEIAVPCNGPPVSPSLLRMEVCVYLVRHGETDYNLRGQLQGSTIDAPLNETGRAQAQTLRDACALPEGTD